MSKSRIQKQINQTKEEEMKRKRALTLLYNNKYRIFEEKSGSVLRITQLDILCFQCIFLQDWFQPLAIDFEIMAILGVYYLNCPIGKNGLYNKRASPPRPELSLEEVKS